ncbi:MAG TPA: hypothetical protein VKU01_15085 [Bryobacteraceae bacterium]|nr:hypothetical protein [Bryobacteraceae bacterium]
MRGVVFLFACGLAGQDTSAITTAAARFAETAPKFMALEKLSQRARSGERFDERHMVAYYGFSTLRNSPGLIELRQLVSVDGKAVAGNEEARKFLRDALFSSDDGLKNKMLGAFAKEGLTGVATDFGQLILLFGSGRIQDFSFQYDHDDSIGSLQTQVFNYAQKTGHEGVRVEGGRKREPLRGKIWVRLPDHVPVRITLATSRNNHGVKTRDEAQVDYAEYKGVLLPAGVLHRQFENDDIVAQDTYEYAAWQPVNPK